MYFSTTTEMAELDRLAVEAGLEIQQMMELAGRHMLTVFDSLNINHTASITVVIGKGNKGGDGLSAARHLINGGYNVSIVLVDRNVSFDNAHQLGLLEKMGIKIVDLAQEDGLIARSDIVIDALIGYRLDGPPRDAFKIAVEQINASNATVIAYDMPTGVDADTGELLDPHITADATLTLALPKKLFNTNAGQSASGRIFLADIGIPSILYDKIKTDSRPTFPANGILEI